MYQSHAVSSVQKIFNPKIKIATNSNHPLFPLPPFLPDHPQLENVDLVVADHVQRVLKPNFAASWDEVGEENQVEETFVLTAMKDVPGERGGACCLGDEHCCVCVCVCVCVCIEHCTASVSYRYYIIIIH